MNSSVVGPILPIHLYDKDWSKIFTSKINAKTKLVGTTIVCLPSTDAGGLGPKIEGFFVTDKIGLSLLMSEKSIFRDHKSKYSAIVNGEYGLSKCILKNKYGIDCMLHRYQGINWNDKKNWDYNAQKHPSRKNSFYGESINPYEVIFHKWYWANQSLVNFDIIDKLKINLENMFAR